MLALPKIFPDHEKLPADKERSGFEVIDPRFNNLILEDSKVTRHWQGAEWSEGAVYLPKSQLIVWSDIPNNRMLQFNPATNETTIFREPSNFTNGNELTDVILRNSKCTVSREDAAKIAQFAVILLKFIYSEKATKFCEISFVDLTVTT